MKRPSIPQKCSAPRAGRARTLTTPPLDPDGEAVVASIVAEVVALPNCAEVLDRLDRLASITAARSAADAHYALVIRRAIDLAAALNCETPTN
jgi:hypothetical protein